MNPGGFLEPCTAAIVRPRPIMALPDRGPFTFPAPWNTTGIRLTNAADTGGGDALEHAGYSYWNNVNAHAGRDVLRVVLCANRNRGGSGPALWEVNKWTLEVTPRGPLFPPSHPLSWATAEGWYWSGSNPDLLYAPTDEKLYRINVVTQAVAVAVDITVPPWAGSGMALRQWHTSRDDRTHSATLKNTRTSNWAAVGSIVYREGATPNPFLTFLPVRGIYDECQVDKSGQWLLVKENVDGLYGEDNIVKPVGGPGERILLDQAGAAGHSDCGFGYMVAADNWHNLPNAIRVWMFDPAAQPQGRVVYHGANWSSDLTHVSHCNAVPGAPEGQYVVGSGASRQAQPRTNEIVGFRLDGALECCVIAPTMSDLDAPGGGADDYSKLPFGNLDPTGEYLLWTSNAGSARLDAFLVKVPTHLLGGAPPGPVCTQCPVHCPPGP